MLDVNENFLALLGTTSEAILGQPYTALLTETERGNPVFRQLQDKALRGEPATARLLHTTRANGPIDLRTAFMRVAGDDGTVAKLFAVVSDDTENAHNESQLHAIDQVQSVIEFGMDGKFLAANKICLETLGYTLEELRGQHHSMFVDPVYRTSPDYRTFWDRLGRGEVIVGEQKRIAKGGREFWTRSTYTPVLAPGAKPFKVMAYFTDITDQKLAMANSEGQLAAIGKVQAVIEFGLDGKVTDRQRELPRSPWAIRWMKFAASTTACSLIPPTGAARNTGMFWEKLGRGEYDEGQYKRIAKGGREVWMQASYNPILDTGWQAVQGGRNMPPNLTEQKLATANFEGQLAAIGKAQAVIEFGLDGKVLTANENFLRTMGYTLEEIRGQHHSLFVDPVFRASPDYRLFWDKLGRGEFDAGQYQANRQRRPRGLATGQLQPNSQSERQTL